MSTRVTYGFVKNEAEKRGLVFRKPPSAGCSIATPMLDLEGNRIGPLMHILCDDAEEAWADVYYAENKAARDIRVTDGKEKPEHPVYTWTKWNNERYHGKTSRMYWDWVDEQPFELTITCNNDASKFSSFVVRAVQEYDVCDGEQSFIQPVGVPVDENTPKIGPVKFGIYGVYKENFEERHITDLNEKDQALQFVKDLNGPNHSYVALSENDVLMAGDEAVEKGGTVWFPVVDSVGRRLHEQKKWVAARRRV